MTTHFTETVWLDAQGELSLNELTQLSDLSEAELRELVEYGALVPIDPADVTLRFGANCIVSIRTACRLRHEFDLNLHALALALRFLDRIGELEAQLRQVHAQLPVRRH